LPNNNGNTLKKIKVNLEQKSYPILIGEGSLSRLYELIGRQNQNKKILAVIDGNVERIHGKLITKALKKFKNNIDYYILKPGERSKSFKELNKIYSYLIDKKFGRDSLLIALGGGVTGDLAGYAASTFMRGIPLIHIPTTLLAAVDSSIGGKTGINFESKKNMIGTFCQPELVLIDTAFLQTLPKAEIKSGLGEVIKYAYMSDRKYYAFVEKNLEKIFQKDLRITEEIIIKSASIKAGVVAHDEKESGLRKILNLGHTFAHAFESELNFKIKHGEAVTAGIIASLYLANKIGILSLKNLNEFLRLPLKANLSDKFFMLNKQNIFELMQSDKKARSGKTKFVLVSNIGKILLDVEAERKEIFFALEMMQRAAAKS
jgi:3-dehydroquinate synthase